MTANTETPVTPAGAGNDPLPGSRWWRLPMAVVVVLFATFWIWAIFFASKESINRIDDRDWAARAQGVCAAATLDRQALTDYRRVDLDDPAQLAERAAVVDRATDILESMLGQVVAVAPDDPKGAELVPMWADDYRTYLGNRRTFTENLRAGRNEPFRELAVDGIPIAERLARFANDNDMPACAPPDDLVN